MACLRLRLRQRILIHLFIHPFFHSLNHSLHHAHVNSRTLLEQSWKKNSSMADPELPKGGRQTRTLADPRVTRTRTPFGSNFFHFHAIFGKSISPNNRFFHQNLGNPGSATAQRRAPTYYSAKCYYLTSCTWLRSDVALVKHKTRLTFYGKSAERQNDIFVGSQ